MTDASGDGGDRRKPGGDRRKPDGERPAGDALAWETLDSAVPYACPGFDVVHEEVRLPDGTETDYDYVSEPPAVVVLPFADGDRGADAESTDGSTSRDDREVVVIEEWRQAVGRVNRGLPAGGVEPGDDGLAAAARRELAEETGHEADRVRRLTTLEPANGIADSVHHYFVAEGCEPTAGQALDHDESIRVDATTFGDLRAAVAEGTVRDARTALAVLYYELFGAGSGGR